MIMLSLKNGRDGKVGITEADAVRFFSMINSGASLKRVALLLDFANRKAKEEAEAKEMRFIQMNSQQQQQTAQVNSAAKRQEVMDKMQADIAVENARGRADVIEKAVAEGQMTWQEALTMLGNVQPEQPQQPQQEQGLIQEPERVMPTQEEVV
jgi:hypothetical protein